jgi:hypothetical protein
MSNSSIQSTPNFNSDGFNTDGKIVVPDFVQSIIQKEALEFKPRQLKMAWLLGLEEWPAREKQSILAKPPYKEAAWITKCQLALLATFGFAKTPEIEGLSENEIKGLIATGLKWSNLEVRAHAKLLNLVERHPALRLYYLCVAKNRLARPRGTKKPSVKQSNPTNYSVNGSGQVRINVTAAAMLLGVSTKTLIKYTENKKLFRTHKKYNGNGYITLNLQALPKILTSYGFSSVGYSGYVTLNDILTVRKCNILAVEMLAIGMQKGSRATVKSNFIEAKKSNKALKKKRLLKTPEELFEIQEKERAKYIQQGKVQASHSLVIPLRRSAADRGNGSLIYGKGLYIDVEQYVVYGVSQQRIADELGRSRLFVNQVLSNIPKIRLYLTGSEKHMMESWEAAKHFDSEHGTHTAKRFFSKVVPGYNDMPDSLLIWQSHVCLYDPCIVLSSMKAFKRWNRLSYSPDVICSEFENPVDYVWAQS